MPEPDGVKELTGIARSIDAVFARLEGGADAPAPAGAAPDVESVEPEIVDLGAPEPPPLAEVVDLDATEPPPLPEPAASAPPPLPEVGALDVSEPPPLPEVVDLEAAAPPPLPELGEADTSGPPPLAADTGTAAPPPLPEVVDLDAPEPPPLPDARPVPDFSEVELTPVADAEVPSSEVPDTGIAAAGFAASASTAASGEDTVEGGAAEGGDEDGEQPTELDMAVEAYLAGDQTQPGEIERLGSEMMERRELDPVARSVVRLAVAAGEPPDRAILGVAKSIMDSVVLEHVVRRLGTERVEENRNQYYQAGRTIGEPMVLALRDGLGDTTTNRLARRNYCDALRAMGDVARPTIEAMAVDENRFLCRNALTLLGEMGGDEWALELVTGQLVNPDARVRREALRSLARIGDEESGAKLMELGLLEDSDEDVRIAAAVAAGELKVTRAVRPLVTMLDETKDPDRAIPLIRVLGQLEDPSAVSVLERFAVPSLFSRPRTDVRIAAYRALYHIGTPHAIKLLAKASSDKEPEVASAVLALRQSESRSANEAPDGETTSDG